MTKSAVFSERQIIQAAQIWCRESGPITCTRFFLLFTYLSSNSHHNSHQDCHHTFSWLECFFSLSLDVFFESQAQTTNKRGDLTFKKQPQGKTILIAVYSHIPEIQRALWRMTGAALAGCILGILCGFGKITWPKRFSASIALAAFLGLCIENHSLRIVLNTSCDLGTVLSRVQVYWGSW